MCVNIVVVLVGCVRVMVLVLRRLLLLGGDFFYFYFTLRWCYVGDVDCFLPFSWVSGNLLFLFLLACGFVLIDPCFYFWFWTLFTCYGRLVVFRIGSVCCSCGFCVVLLWTPLVWWSCDYLRGVSTSPCVWVWCSSRRLLCLLCLYADCIGGVVSVGISRLSTDMGSHIMSMCCVLSAIFLLVRNISRTDQENNKQQYHTHRTRQ